MKKRFVVLTGTILFACTQLAVFCAAASEAEILENECHKQLNLGASGCECVAERAGNVLNEKQQRMVVAMVTQDQAASAELRAQMSVEEMTGAANFMTETPTICAGQ